MKKGFVDNINNLQCMSPTFQLDIKEEKINDKVILVIEVPCSSMVHKNRNRIFIRNEELSIKICEKYPQE